MIFLSEKIRTGRSGRTPQSAHHPHKSHDEHRQCNPGGGVYFALLLGFDNSYTTPSKKPLLDRKPFVVVVYGWWSRTGNRAMRETFDACDAKPIRSYRRGDRDHQSFCSGMKVPRVSLHVGLRCKKRKTCRLPIGTLSFWPEIPGIFLYNLTWGCRKWGFKRWGWGLSKSEDI